MVVTLLYTFFARNVTLHYSSSVHIPLVLFPKPHDFVCDFRILLNINTNLMFYYS